MPDSDGERHRTLEYERRSRPRTRRAAVFWKRWRGAMV